MVPDRTFIAGGFSQKTAIAARRMTCLQSHAAFALYFRPVSNHYATLESVCSRNATLFTGHYGSTLDDSAEERLHANGFYTITSYSGGACWNKPVGRAPCAQTATDCGVVRHHPEFWDEPEIRTRRCHPIVVPEARVAQSVAYHSCCGMPGRCVFIESTLMVVRPTAVTPSITGPRKQK
jgi:hypothetical protein